MAEPEVESKSPDLGQNIFLISTIMVRWYLKSGPVTLPQDWAFHAVYSSKALVKEVTWLQWDAAHPHSPTKGEKRGVGKVRWPGLIAGPCHHHSWSGLELLSSMADIFFPPNTSEKTSPYISSLSQVILSPNVPFSIGSIYCSLTFIYLWPPKYQCYGYWVWDEDYGETLQGGLCWYGKWGWSVIPIWHLWCWWGGKSHYTFFPHKNRVC